MRFHRGHRFKPTREGVNQTLSLRFYTDSTIVNRRIVGGRLIASVSCPGITVTP